MRRVSNYISLVIICLLGLAAQPAAAQQAVHMQSEAGQYFTVEVSCAQFTSTLNGYLQIPDLRAGVYDIQVGIPGQGAEYIFRCAVGEGQTGYYLRREVDNGWTLFNLVDFTETRGIQAAVWKEQLQAKQREEQRRLRDESKKTGVSAGISKIYDRASSGGVDQVYVVMDGTRRDTIALFIPVLEEKPTGALRHSGGADMTYIAARRYEAEVYDRRRQLRK